MAIDLGYMLGYPGPPRPPTSTPCGPVRASRHGSHAPRGGRFWKMGRNDPPSPPQTFPPPPHPSAGFVDGRSKTRPTLTWSHVHKCTQNHGDTKQCSSLARPSASRPHWPRVCSELPCRTGLTHIRAGRVTPEGTVSAQALRPRICQIPRGPCSPRWSHNPDSCLQTPSRGVS